MRWIRQYACYDDVIGMSSFHESEGNRRPERSLFRLILQDKVCFITGSTRGWMGNCA